MDFGRLDNIEEVDFSLPPDHPMTDELLARLQGGKQQEGKKEPVRLYVGCAKWGRKDWIGKVYPKGTKDKDFLAHYVKQFNCIELNALFYNLQPKEVIERWASLADRHFRFCPKFSNTISHLRQLKNAERETDLFIDHMQGFGSGLGPSFLQLSDRFTPDRAVTLQDYIRQLPRDFSTCIELRHGDWFCEVAGTQQSGPVVARNTAVVKDTWELFRDLCVGTVITDTSGRRDCLHMKLTAPVAFIRYVGNNLHPTDFTRIDAWVDRVKTWIDKGLKEIYFFIHNHEELNSPELCKYAVNQFNKKCGLHLKPPELLNEEPPGTLSLF